MNQLTEDINNLFAAISANYDTLIIFCDAEMKKQSPADAENDHNFWLKKKAECIEKKISAEKQIRAPHPLAPKETLLIDALKYDHE